MENLCIEFDQVKDKVESETERYESEMNDKTDHSKLSKLKQGIF